MTIVLADDHELVRAGIRKILEDEAGFEVVAEAGDAETAARYVLGHKPSVLVLDLSMPGMPSLEALPKVFENVAGDEGRRPDDAERARVRPQGAAGRSEGIRHQALSGQRARDRHPRGDRRRHLHQSRARSARLAAEPDKPEGPPDELTPREVEVLGLLALGYVNPEIAEKLVLSVRTVETHRANIQRKTGLSTRAELIAYAIDNELVER